MSSSPLRRVLSATLLAATLSFLSPPVEAARAVTIGRNDSIVPARLDALGFLGRLWEELSQLWAADGARADPNGHA